MPPVELATTEPETAASKAQIGIIYPPPEVRNIVDKTASFVARNGPEFEARIRQNELNNPKFNFLNPADPYYAYYQHKVREFQEGKGLEPSAQKQVVPLPVQETVREAEPKEPPPAYEYVADPPSISAFDLDLVRLTAQFVARNGRQFLTQLMQRESRNSQFDFLRPQHSLFGYFTKMVEQYSKVLMPSRDLLARLRLESSNQRELMRMVGERVKWERFQRREREKEEEAAEKERIAYAQIDWHDFVVVETVDYLPYEQGQFPPPTTPEEVGARVLLQERMERIALEEKAVAEVEMEVDNDDEPPAEPERPPAPVLNEPVVIRKDYNPKMSRANPQTTPDQFLVSPLTGEKIPAHKMTEHMRYGLLDPKWMEQKNREQRERQEQEQVFAPGSDIDRALKGIAERRTDIFGRGDSETMIGRKMGEEELNPKAIIAWDGHALSAEKATRDALVGITVAEQIHAIHRQQGLVEEEGSRIGPKVPDARPPGPPQQNVILGPPPPVVVLQPPPMQPAPLLPIRPLVPVMSIPNQMAGQRGPSAMPFQPFDEPPSKRAKEDDLMPELEILRRFGSNPVQLHVQLPVIPDKNEWKLNGQVVSITLPLSESVATLKQKLTEMTGMPVSKQKLQLDGMFIKDSLTLAFYNMQPGSTLALQVKERGGRKK